MSKEGILKVQLFNLEKSAETLERIIYNDLTALHSLPDSKVEAYEPRVLRKLEKLDAIQDGIDTVTAELKAAGWYESRSLTGNVYEYKRPKYELPKPAPKKKPKQARKVYPVESPKKAPPEKHVPDRDRKPKAAKAPAVRPTAKPVPRPKPTPKSKELLKAEKGVYDAIRDRAKQEAIFEDKRLRAEQNIATAKARLEQYANVSAKEGGHQFRSRARILLASSETRLRELPELKAERLRELSERQAGYQAEVRRLTENASQQMV
jgi:outer membrane biosynthesis protein TonB